MWVPSVSYMGVSKRILNEQKSVWAMWGHYRMLKSWFPKQETGLIKLSIKTGFQKKAYNYLHLPVVSLKCLVCNPGLVKRTLLTLCTSCFSNRPNMAMQTLISIPSAFVWHHSLISGKVTSSSLQFSPCSFSLPMSFLFTSDRWLIITDWSGPFYTNASPVLSCMCATLTPALALCITHHYSIFHRSCWANPSSQWAELIAGSYQSDYTANGWFQRLYSSLISNRVRIWWKTYKNGLVGKQAHTHSQAHTFLFIHTYLKSHIKEPL